MSPRKKTPAKGEYFRARKVVAKGQARRRGKGLREQRDKLCSNCVQKGHNISAR